MPIDNTSPIKVLHFYKTALPYSHGGVEVFMDALCRSTSVYGIKHTILALTKNPKLTYDTNGYYSLQYAKQNFAIASTGFSIEAFGLFKKLADQADIIHYHFPNPMADLLHFMCRIKKPSLITYHSDIIKQKKLLLLYKPLMNQFLRKIDHIVATSPNYLQSSVVLQKFTQKTTVIPIGIDHQHYPSVDPERLHYWRQKLPNPFFLFIGALRYYKGLHIALEAIKGTNLCLAIGGSGGIEPELRKLAQRYKLNHVHFLGFLSEADKVALLTLCYGFIFPSHLRSEAFGISLLEAAAYGKPMISCEIGTGTSYINIHQKTGLVIPPGQVAALRDAMQWLRDHPTQATEWGNNAKQRAISLFSQKEQAKAYNNLYRELLSE